MKPADGVSYTGRQLLTVAEAAERLSLGYSTLRRYIDDGRLPAVRIPTGENRDTIRITVPDLEDFVRGHRTAGVAEGDEEAARKAREILSRTH